MIEKITEAEKQLEEKFDANLAYYTKQQLEALKRIDSWAEFDSQAVKALEAIGRYRLYCDNDSKMKIVKKHEKFLKQEIKYLVYTKKFGRQPQTHVQALQAILQANRDNSLSIAFQRIVGNPRASESLFQTVLK